jgi:hypothetical protein
VTELRLGVALPGLDAAGLVRIAPDVELNGLHQLWVGDPRADAVKIDDSWILTTTGALTGVTRHIRLAAVLNLETSVTPLWLAEDVGVADQAAGGRLDLAFLAPPGNRDEWEQRVRLALTAWRGWRLADGRTVPVTPPPAQTFVPRVIAGEPDGRRLAALGAGALIRQGEALPDDGALREVVRVTEMPVGDVAAFLGGDPVRAVEGLRALSGDGAVDTLVVVLPGSDDVVLRWSLSYLGRVVAPALRCADFQVPAIVESAYGWLHEKAHLHEVAERL